MKAREIRRRTSTDLTEELKRLSQQVFEQRFRGQSEEKVDHGLVTRTRKDAARIRTILRERELGLRERELGLREREQGRGAEPKTGGKEKT